MIQITPQMRIFLAYESPDFRCGIDGLAAICREQLGEDPFSGAWFLFRNRKGTSIKALVYDGQGFWICQKRLSNIVIPPRLDTQKPSALISCRSFRGGQEAPEWISDKRSYRKQMPEPFTGYGRDF